MVKNRVLVIAAVTAVIVSAGAETATAAVGEISVTVDAGKTGDPITKYIYGGFIEHLGNLINYGLWSELLDDRKFYFPVNSEEAAPDSRGGRGGMRRWGPLGAGAFVVMDREYPYAGDQSPVIKLERLTPHGIQQSGISLLYGKQYTGWVVLAGDAGAKVIVSLVWGPDPDARQTVSIGALQKNYAKFPLKFTSQANSNNGRLEIAGTGTGSFRVGTASLMPADNIRGFRPDTIKLLKQLNSGFYRLPGGNFLSNHDWRDAIGDPDTRPSTWDYHWSSVQPNDVGMDELMFLCDLLGVEPYVSVNAGFGEARSAADLVEYANGTASTPMGRLRASNGHAEPYKVKFWNIGNEAYGWWQLGHMVLNQYAIKHNMFAKAMRKVDPSITIIASGAMPDEMTVTGSARRTTGNVQAEFGSPADWTGGLLAKSWGSFDMLAEHYYGHNDLRFDLEEGQKDSLPIQDLPQVRGGGAATGWVRTDEPLIDWAHRPANRVRLKAEAWQEYLKRFPVLKDSKVSVSLDEWAYSGAPRDLKLDLSIALAFHEMFRHTDFLKMAAYTMALSWIDYSRTDAVYNTTGLLFKLYREHFGTVPVDVTGNSPPPPPKYPVGGDQPRVNAGSSTYPLDVSAALSSDRKALTVAVVNPTESAWQVDLNIQVFQPRDHGRVWKLTGPTVNASNRLGQPPQVGVVQTQFNGAPKTLSVAPISINLYELEAR